VFDLFGFCSLVIAQKDSIASNYRVWNSVRQSVVIHGFLHETISLDSTYLLKLLYTIIL
jgi:hypothetical protein